MKLIKVAAAALNQTPLDWDGNRANILQAINEARMLGASVLCLPELCISGYGCEDAFHGPGTARMASRVLAELLPETQGLIVNFGLPIAFKNALFNGAALAVDGRLMGFVAKQNLAGEGLHYEPRWFKPWPAGRRAEIEWDTLSETGEFPLGDVYFDCGGVRIGFEICEDAWVASRPGGALSGRAVDIILNPSASHFAFGKHAVRQRFVLEGSRAFGVAYIYTNLLGNEAGRAIYDGDTIIASGGKMISMGPRFSYSDVVVTAALIDLEANRMQHARNGSFVPDLNDDDRCVRAAFQFPEFEPEEETMKQMPWEKSDEISHEEFSRAIALGLFDYMRKSRSRGFVISLSGGADSAACACLVGLMVRFGLGELGPAGFCAKISWMKELCEKRKAEDITRALLTTVYQATKNSSQTTRDAAAAIAGAIGSQHYEFDVDSLVGDYRAMIEGAIGRELTWEKDDLALQNIQARVRAPGVWMLANLNGALLVATSNRSEAAVGYATMDGDTCGGISPIAGIDKHFLRGWLRWMEASGPQDIGPIAALEKVNAQQPTAELRPPGEGQTDEGDLMPYDVLEAIEDAAIRDKQPPREAFRVVRARFSQYSDDELREWVKRFFRLWSRNQWKRERYAPSFHVDDKNLDPKTWCRFPILSGGFERELGELTD